MTVNNFEKAEGKLKFTVDADAAEFESAVNKAYLAMKKDIYVPGFRKGKAPRAVVEGMYGKEVFYDDAINNIAPDAYKQAMDDRTDKTVGQPSVTDYKVNDDKSVTITFETTLYPEVTLGEYKGITAYKAPVEVTDADVDAEIDKTRVKNARITVAERPLQNGDTANIDFTGYKEGVPFDGGEGKDYDLVIGSGTFVPGFEDQLIGMSAGEEKDIDITFPEDYHADLAGAAVVFHVKVNEVKESALPELDDDFAKDVSEFDTLAEYKADVAENLKKTKEDDADKAFKSAALGKAVEAMKADIPAVMVDEQLEELIEQYRQTCQMQGMTLEQYFASMGINENMFKSIVRPSAENDVKVKLLLEAVADAEKLEASDDEIEEEYKRLADNYSMELDNVKASVTPNILANDIILRKAADVIYDSAIATDVPEKKEEEPAEAPAEEPAADKE